MSSLLVSFICGNIVHTGVQDFILSSCCQLHPEGLRRTGCVFIRLWAQKCPPWYTERLVCCRSASWVGRMFPRVLDFLKKSSCLASLTFVRLMAKRSTAVKQATSTPSCNEDRVYRVAVSSGNTPQISHLSPCLCPQRRKLRHIQFGRGTWTNQKLFHNLTLRIIIDL